MKKIKKLLDKKLIKITGIIISLFILFILVEYGYSQRWRLEKDVGIENYEYFIVNRKFGINWLIKPHLFSFISKRKLFKPMDFSSVLIRKEFTSPLFLNDIHFDWKIDKNILILHNGRIQFQDTIIDNHELSKEVSIDKRKTIIHLGKNYLVFDEKDNSVMFPFIPRKKMYEKLKPNRKNFLLKIKNFFFEQNLPVHP